MSMLDPWPTGMQGSYAPVLEVPGVLPLFLSIISIMICVPADLQLMNWVFVMPDLVRMCMRFICDRAMLLNHHSGMHATVVELGVCVVYCTA